MLRGLCWEWEIGRFESGVEKAVVVLGMFTDVLRINFHE